MNKAFFARDGSKGSRFMLFLLAYNLLFSFALRGVYGLLESSSASGFFATPWFLIGGQLLSLILPLGLWLSLTGDRIRHSLPFMKLGKSNVVFIVCICFFLMPLMYMVSALSALLFENQIAGVMFVMQDYPYPLLVATFALTPAVCEELVFRGYILHQYRHVPIKKAAWLTGLFFGIIHLDGQQFFYALFLGVVFAYFVYYTRSFRAGVLAHFVINFYSVTYAWVVSRLSENTPAASAAAAQSAHSALWMAIAFWAMVSVIFLIGLIPLSNAFLTYNRQRNIKYDMKTKITEGVTDEGDAKPPKLWDFCTWAVVVLYLLYVIGSRWVS
jgi:hypothetical protein